MSDFGNYRFADVRRSRIADPSSEGSFAAVSPLKHVQAIEAPVLLIHSEEDVIVPAEAVPTRAPKA